MKIIYNKLIPFGAFTTINLFGVLFTKEPLSERVVNHEYIHAMQMRELLFVPFYLWYLCEWLVRLVQYRNAFVAYKNICFEREAFACQSIPDYRHKRRSFAFVHYLRRVG